MPIYPHDQKISAQPYRPCKIDGLTKAISRFDRWWLSVIVVTTVDVLNFLELQRPNSRFMTTLDVLIAIPVIPFEASRTSTR